VAEAHDQSLTLVRFLADPATGPFFHGWRDHARHNYGRALGARQRLGNTNGPID
jgi:rhamnogalacturonyl hydrolase YesR